MELVVVSGLSMLRWAAWIWMAIVLAVNADSLRRPWLGFGLVAAALAYTVAATFWVRARTTTGLRPRVVGIELALAVALVLCDGWAYDGGHAFTSAQSLGSLWPLLAVLDVGVVFGGRWGAAAGVLLGISRLGAVLANTIRTFDDGRILSLINTAVFYGVAGLIAGYVFGLLRRAEVQISATAARDEVARTLHDGVLQTLAIVERRSSDPDLVRLAREQDRELRGFLFGDYLAGQGGRDLGAALRHAAARFEEAFGIRAEVVVADDLPRLDEVRVTAVSRAVGEALTNAGKHGNPSRVTVFVEPTDDHAIFCSVKDDGAGFDPAARTTGTGIRRSIMDRMRDAGGQAEVRSGQGSGTEVCLWA